MTDTENAARLRRCSKDPLGTVSRERKWFLAKYLLAGDQRGNCHFLMQQVRRHDRDCVNIRTLKERFVVVDQIELVGGREGRRHFRIDIASGDDLETRAVRKTAHNLLAP